MYYKSCVFITGVCSSRYGLHAKVVLAGDPKQLDAVCKSQHSAKLGYKTSLMERLYYKPLYRPQSDSETSSQPKKYNTKYITQLIQNYRSHKAILIVANIMFYDGTLVAKAPEGN